MNGIVESISKGFYNVNVDGVIYNTSPKFGFFSKKINVKVGDNVELDPDSFLIIKVIDKGENL